MFFKINCTTLLLLITIATFGQSITDIAKSGIKSTVSIVALDSNMQPLGYGSGFVIDSELIATNIHVINGCSSAYVLLDGNSKKYSVSGYVAIDKQNDIVLLKVPNLYGDKVLLGTEGIPEIGERIYAIGNPKGLSGTFSEGIISGIRTIENNQLLQITAPISPGSSGGPVVNSKGQVIGIAVGSYKDGQSLNFAIPVKYLLKLKSQIGTTIALSTVKSQSGSASKSSVPANIKDGVVVRNIEKGRAYGGGEYYLNFSIKNNLPYTISNIRILFTLYDDTGTVIDYKEGEFPNSWETIKPFLAIYTRAIDAHFLFRPGYKIGWRILDFKINDDE